MWNKTLAFMVILGTWLAVSIQPVLADDDAEPSCPKAAAAAKAKAAKAKAAKKLMKVATVKKAMKVGKAKKAAKAKQAKAPAKAKVAAKAKAPASRPASQPAKLNAKEALVKTFWEAVIRYDFQTLFGITGVPFVNDAKCNIFGDFKDLEAFLRKQNVPKNVKIGRPSIVKSGYTKFKFVRSGLDTLSPASTNCKNPKANKMIDAVNSYEVDFILVTLTVGTKRIPTMMRLNKIKGRWLITGLVN